MIYDIKTTTIIETAIIEIEIKIEIKIKIKININITLNKIL